MARESDSRKFGVVLFDDVKEPMDGFSCVAGKTPSRISGINELSTDVIWWTNIPYQEFYNSTEAWRSPWLRHDKYLVVSPRDALIEWAIDPATADINIVANIAAQAFDGVMRLAFRLIKDVEPRAKMEDVFTGKFLREDLRRLLPELEYPQGEAASIMKSGAAFQEFTKTSLMSMRGGRWVTLRKPRLSYAHEMLQTPVPKGPYEFYGRADMRSFAKKNNNDKAGWVVKHDQPCMSEIAINKFDADVSTIYGFGNATDKDKRIARSWISHPEILIMNKFSEIDVKSIYMAEEYDLLGPQLPEPVKDFLTDKLAETSWSAGIVAETLWRAIPLAEDKTKPGAAVGGDRAHTSWQGAWLKGADKTSMFLSAMQLTEKGYSVVSYGLGWLKVSVLDDNIPDLIKDGLSVGLIPQILDVLPTDSRGQIFHPNELTPWGGDKAAKPFAHFIATGSRDLLWGLDRAMIMPNKEKRKIIIANAQKTHKRWVSSLT